MEAIYDETALRQAQAKELGCKEYGICNMQTEAGRLSGIATSGRSAGLQPRNDTAAFDRRISRHNRDIAIK